MPEQEPVGEAPAEEPNGDEQWNELDRRVKAQLDDALGRFLSKETLHPILDDYFGGLAPEGGTSAEPNAGGNGSAAAGAGEPNGTGGSGEPATPKSAAGTRTEGGGVLTFLLGKPARK